VGMNTDAVVDWRDEHMVDCNLDVEGFKIYGEFR